MKVFQRESICDRWPIMHMTRKKHQKINNISAKTEQCITLNVTQIYLHVILINSAAYTNVNGDVQ